MSSFDKSQTRKTNRKMKATAKKTTMMKTKATKATRSEHGKSTITFSKLVDKLQQHYGAPAPPPSTDPLELIIGRTSRIWRMTSVEPKRSPFSNEPSVHALTRFLPPSTLLWQQSAKLAYFLT